MLHVGCGSVCCRCCAWTGALEIRAKTVAIPSIMVFTGVLLGLIPLRPARGDERDLYRVDDPLEDVLRSHQRRGEADRVADGGIAPAAANAEEKGAQKRFL